MLSILKERKSFLDAVVFSGGEPCYQDQLAEAIKQVKNEGFKVGLHTGGANPVILQKVLTLIDWLGLDVKCAREDYAELTGIANSGENAFASLSLALQSPVELEVRTTIDPCWHSEKRLRSLAEQLAKIGVEQWVIQKYLVAGSINNAAEQASFAGAIETIGFYQTEAPVHPDGRCRLSLAGISSNID